MKRMIRATSDSVIFEDENFEFMRESGVGMGNTPWTGLVVVTKNGSLAEKHVVQIRMIQKGFPEYNGTPIEHSYSGCYVAHGMRSQTDTFDDTREYIEVLEDALDFAERVSDWLYKHDRIAN